MVSNEKTKITIEATIHAPVDKVWEYWTAPEHITQWNFATDEWHYPRAENDLKAGGKLFSRMEAKDGSIGKITSKFNYPGCAVVHEARSPLLCQNHTGFK